MVPPNQETQQRDRDRRICDKAIAENSLVAVHANQLTDHAKCWQNHDVDSGVAVEPKEVLEGDRVTVVLGIKNPNVHRPFGNQQQQSDAQNGSRQHLDDAGRISCPKEQWHSKPSHPWRPHRVDRNDEVQTREDRTEAQNKGSRGGQNHRRITGRTVRSIERPTRIQPASQQG